MFVSFNTINSILRTLPIGYYCGRQVPVALDDKEPTSYYSPMENRIVISYPIIMEGLEKVSDENYTETAVRSMLYHEISHVIMTPKNLMSSVSSENRQLINIFEDERIETLLKDYYLDVNFKEQLHNIVTLDTSTTDPMQRFFNIVRFRVGEPQFIAEVDKIIKDYQHLTVLSDDYWEERQYINAIIDLYDKIASSAPAPAQSAANSQTGFDDIKQLAEALNGLMGEGQSESAAEAQNEGEDAQNEGENAKTGKGPYLTTEAIKEIAKQAVSPTGTLDATASQQLASAETIIERLISNFNKKNKGGAGFNAYSGVFNPRAVMREDYKFFERSTPANGNAKYGTCRLNLFLDRSGSFYRNQNIVNALLAFLSEIERKNHNFSLSVSFINDDFVTCQTVKDRVMECCGSNRLPSNLTELFNGLQKKDSYNYNIFLFDGDAMCNNYGSIEDRKAIFKQIDQSHTCLITDSSNRCYMNNNRFTKAKVIVTSQYTEQLIDNITKAFHIMFA